MSRFRPITLLLVAGAMLYIGALTFGTHALLRSESLRAEAALRAEMRLALWRTESWITGQLVREAARRPSEWRAFTPVRAATASSTEAELSEDSNEELWQPSVLLGLESDLFAAYFEVHADRALTSPQVPEGPLLDRACVEGLTDHDRIDAVQSRLTVLRAHLSGGWDPSRAYSAAEAMATMEIAPPPFDEPAPMSAQRESDRMAPQAQLRRDVGENLARREWVGQLQEFAAPPSPERDAPIIALRSSSELLDHRAMKESGEDESAIRARSAARVGPSGSSPPGRGGALSGSAPPRAPRADGDALDQIIVPGGTREAFNEVLEREPGGAPPRSVGPMLTMWLGAPGSAESLLIAMRRVVDADGVRHQGLVIDWEVLSAALSQRLREAGVAASPQPLTESVQDAFMERHALAAVPVVIEPLPPSHSSHLPMGTLIPLVVLWCGGLAAMFLSAGAVITSMRFGSERARFASALTHELRTPLTTFRLYAEMLDEGLVRGEKERGEAIHLLRTESERLSLLVANMLAWARLERGGEGSRGELHRLEALAGAIASPLRQRAAIAQRPIEIRVQSSSEESAAPERLIRCDAEAVGRIALNLVDNACKYAVPAEDPVIEVEIGIVQSASQREGDARLVLRVRDRGPGIDSARQRAIFLPFDRGAHADDPLPGVGLGLALARGMARRMGGELVLEPSPQGACFRLEV